MDSKETTPEVETSTENVEQPESWDQETSTDNLTDFVEVDGQKLTLDELKDGYMRHSDYTRKTQELSKKRKELDSKPKEELTDEELAADEYLKKRGYVTKDDLENFKAVQEDELKLQRLVDANPDLRQYEDAIKTIWLSDESAYEDIVVNYWFTSKDKLQKAKSANRSVKWENTKGSKQKSIMDATPEEYEKRKAEQWVGRWTKFTKKFI